MKMKNVITAARSSHPRIMAAVDDLRVSLACLGGVIGDFTNVKSESARSVLNQQCMLDLSRVEAKLQVLKCELSMFGDVLSKYVRKFKEDPAADGGGNGSGELRDRQQMLPFAPEGPGFPDDVPAAPELPPAETVQETEGEDS